MNYESSLGERDFAAMKDQIDKAPIGSARRTAESLGEMLSTYFLIHPVDAKLMNFIEKIFHSKNFVSLRGYDRAVREIYLSRDKFTDAQLGCISSWIRDTYGKGVDSDYALMACDFIARANSFEVALPILESMLWKSDDASSVGGVLLGLDVLRTHSMLAARPSLELDQLMAVAIDRIEKLGSNG